jgi:alkylation response protein AidB-like acyl-CoA dehydrogenase
VTAVTASIASVLDRTRAVAEREIAPAAAAVDREREFPAAGCAALGDCGALGLLVPEAAGGAGGGPASLAEACETVGAACASTGMVFLMHSVTAATMAAGGGEAAAAVVRGRWRCAAARVTHPLCRSSATCVTRGPGR